MKFFELTKESQSCAKEALKELILRQPANQSRGFKNLAEDVADAFVAMERHESTPEIKIGDGTTVDSEGRSGSSCGLVISHE